MNPFVYEKDQNQFEADYKTTSSITSSFQEILKKLMDQKHMTIEQLAEQVGLNPRTIGRYREGTYAPGLQVVIAICMVLNLDIKQSYELMGGLGLSLFGSRKEHCAYLYLLQNYRGASISRCNSILRSLGISEAYLLYSRKA